MRAGFLLSERANNGSNLEVESGGGNEQIFGGEWCKKGESGVKWGIERGYHAQNLGEGGENQCSWAPMNLVSTKRDD